MSMTPSEARASRAIQLFFRATDRTQEHENDLMELLLDFANAVREAHDAKVRKEIGDE
jgi:hypothetical protein